MDIQDLSAHFLLQRLRTNHGEKVRGRKTKRMEVATRKVGKVARDKGLKGRYKKVFSPRGGAWRAWVRMHSSGQGGRCDLSALAVSYRDVQAARSALFLRAMRLGKAARFAGQWKRKSESSFGDRGREQRQANLQRVHRVLVELTSPLEDGAEKARALSARAAIMGMGLESALSMGHAVRRIDAIAKKQHIEESLALLEDYSRKEGGDAWAALKEYVPGVLDSTPQPDEFEPSPIGPIAHVSAPSSASVSESLTWLAEHGQQSNLGTGVDRMWEAWHKAIDRGGPLANTAAAASTCYSLGMCVCDEEGKKLHRLALPVIALIKRAAKQPGQQRKLHEGYMVVRLNGGPSARRGLEAALVAENAFVELWLHSGFTLLKPWLSETMAVKPAAAPPGEPPATEVRCYVAPTGDFGSLHTGLKPIAGCDDVSIRMYLLESTLRPIGSAAPTIVPLAPMPGFGKPIAIRGTGSRQKKEAGAGIDDLPPDADAPEGVDDVELADPEDVVMEALGDKSDPIDDVATVLAELYEAPTAAPILPPPPPRPVQVGGSSGSGSAGVAPPPPPPLPPPAEPPPAAGGDIEGRRAQRGRAKADPRGTWAAAEELALGTIKVYTRNNNFVAECSAKDHTKCFLTRKRHMDPRSGKGGQPLGLMMAWLEQGSEYEGEDAKGEHLALANEIGISFDDRQRARDRLMEYPNGLLLASYEEGASGVEPLEL